MPGDADNDPDYPRYGGDRRSIGEAGVDLGASPVALYDPAGSDDIMSYGATAELVATERDSEPTFADAILDRLVHNAYRLELDGPSLRKTTGRDAASTIDQQVDA